MPACQKNPFAKELKLIFKNTPSRPGSPEGRQQASAKLYVNFIINFTKNKARKTILTDTEDIASISADRASYKHNTNTERPSEDGVQFVTSNSD